MLAQRIQRLAGSYGNCRESEQRSGGYLANFSNTFVSRSAQQKEKTGRALTKWRRNGARAQTLVPSLLKEDPKTATARLDQQLAAAGIPNGPPQSPELRNTDA
jgi:hypothetical protein